MRAQHEINRAEAMHAALHAQSERLKQASDAQPGLIAQQELDDAQAKDLSSQAQVDAAKAAMAAAQQHASGSAGRQSSACRRCRTTPSVTAPHRRRCDLALCRYRRADPGRHQLKQPGPSHRAPIAKRAAAPARSGAGRRCAVCPRGRLCCRCAWTRSSRSFTGKIVRFTRNVNFETRTHGDGSRCGEQGPLHRARACMQTRAATGARKQRGHDSRRSAGAESSGSRRSTCSTAAIAFTFATLRSACEGSKLAEIKSGLSPGDRVLIGGQEKYHEDEEVNPLLAPQPASETVQETGGMIDMKAEETRECGGRD